MLLKITREDGEEFEIAAHNVVIRGDLRIEGPVESGLTVLAPEILVNNA